MCSQPDFCYGCVENYWGKSLKNKVSNKWHNLKSLMFLTFTYLFLQIFYCSPKIRVGKNRHHHNRQVERNTLHDAASHKVLQMPGFRQKNPKHEDWRQHCRYNCTMLSTSILFFISGRLQWCIRWVKSGYRRSKGWGGGDWGNHRQHVWDEPG